MHEVILRAVGTMSGTSMDGVDVALIETDGRTAVRPVRGAHETLSYSEAERAILFKAVETANAIDAADAVDHPDVKAAAAVSTRRHIDALKVLIARLDTPPDLIGYHGQTVLHRPNAVAPDTAFTLQLGDADAVADATGIPVVHDFRAADMAAGGEGAPLAPLYHWALLTGRTALPALVLNLGGIANISFVTDGGPEELIAADIGPANVFMDDLMRASAGVAYDQDSALAASGRIDRAVVDDFFRHPFFTQDGPKSLDRYSFKAPDLTRLALADAMATLAELTVESVVQAVERLPARPKSVLVAGGGARNMYVMGELARRLTCPVTSLDTIGASAAMLEAEAFAYLAVRHRRGLPLTYPNTTGVAEPTKGGRLAMPSDKAGDKSAVR